MVLPTSTKPEDIKSIVNYLITKPAGATLKEIKTVLGSKIIDPRKLAAFYTLNVITRDGERFKLTNKVGRKLGRASEEDFSRILLGEIGCVRPYRGVLEWAYHNELRELPVSEVGAHWHDNFRQDLGTEKESEILHKAVCFLQLCSGAGLGKFIMGRRGQPSRLVIARDVLEGFAKAEPVPVGRPQSEGAPEEITSVEAPEELPPVDESKTARSKRVYITHGKNKRFVEPIKKLLKFGELESIVSVEKQSVSEPVPDKVMNDMRTCGAAIIHVEDEKHLLDKKGQEHIVLNPNVLIEIGAAMALYGRRFILFVKEGVKLPSNLQGLFEVRYKSDSLDGDSTVKLLEAINDMKTRTVP